MKPEQQHIDPHFDKTFCTECGRIAEECEGHPEAICDDCGGRNVVWFAPNEIWNKVCRPNGENDADPMLCPTCFILRAIKAGIGSSWGVSPAPHASTQANEPALIELVDALVKKWTEDRTLLLHCAKNSATKESYAEAYMLQSHAEEILKCIKDIDLALRRKAK